MSNDQTSAIGAGAGGGAGAAAAPAPEQKTTDTKPAQDKTNNWLRTVFPTAVISLIVLGVIDVGLWAGFSATTSWLSTLGLLTVLFLYLGWLLSERPLGILVNTRNLMSLSRFQIVAWSLVIISAFLTIAFRRIAGKIADPLQIPMDQHLWALLGISTASLVGSPLILQSKANQTANKDQIKAAGDALDEKPEDIEKLSDGKLYANAKIEDARITDMFQGDEIGNTAYVDISKVQMFLFTIIIIVSYCYDIYAMLGSSAVDKLAMPVLSGSVVALLGISHAGYLTSKTADHTPNTPPTPAS
jgi:hypothetical protein